MTCAQGLLRLLWGGPKLECYGTGTHDSPTYGTPSWLSQEILKQVQTEFNPMLGYKLASFHLQIQKGQSFACG